MKLLITGANGFVAGSIIAQIGSKHMVHGLARTIGHTDRPNVHFHAVDLLDSKKLSILFESIVPDVVIHTAALANIDFCEKNQELAEAVNVDLTADIAGLCAETGARLLHCSTDTVFDGIKGNYAEDDLPNPVNFYGITKLRAEGIVVNASPQNIVARLSLVMGFPTSGKGNSFLADMITKLKNRQPVTFPANEIRTPVDVLTLGSALIELAERTELSGIIHLAGNTKIDRYSMAKQIAEVFELPTDFISGSDSNSIAARAPRPDDASLKNDLAAKLLKTKMLSLTEALTLTLNQKMKQSI